MLLKMFEDIIVLEYKNYTIYAHNLKNFDGILLFRLLLTKYELKPLFKDNCLLSLTLKNKDNPKINIRMLDSLSLLPNNLRDLAKSFEVETQKGNFPYDFVNENNLDYIGSLPHYEYYIFNKDYSFNNYLKELINSKWCLRSEIFKYLENDLKSLYKILNSFNKMVHDEFSLNIINKISILSLALNIFTSNFMKHNNIKVIKGKDHKDIRNAYYGGRVDVFKLEGDNLYYYDVNSLYPYSILNDMPVGNPVYTTNTNLKDLFGFVYADIKTPDDLFNPVLPYRTEDGLLINSLGSWSGWYFIEELKQVEKFGYTINVKYGYTFERGKDVFTEYVSLCYLHKKISKDALKSMYKLLLNSLYERIGMNEIHDRTIVLNDNELNDYLTKYHVKSIFNIQDNKNLINYDTRPDKILFNLTENNYDESLIKFNIEKIYINQSISIAAAIISYSRMYMNELMHLKDYEVYYSDTDSIVLDKPLPKEMISNEIGKLKLEYKVKKDLFIAPKLYLLLTDNDKIIIKGRSIGLEELNFLDSISLNLLF